MFVSGFFLLKKKTYEKKVDFFKESIPFECVRPEKLNSKKL